jgi:transposase InsO family protein
MIQIFYEKFDGIFGYRRMTMNINQGREKPYNHKRIYRLMQLIHLNSVIRRRKYNYVKSTPQVTAENLLNRKFTANKLNEKWLTDVTELKYGNGQKAYLSAILDLKDRRIVSFVIGHSNNNRLVFDTFDKAVELNPGVKPLFHSDRGYQYTSKSFKAKLDKAGMTQSMSRVGRCIDNGPMEGFWGILKSEMLYLHKYDSYESLKLAVERYMFFYNHKRLQENLHCLAPLEYHDYLLNAVAS